MINSENITIIVEKMLSNLRKQIILSYSAYEDQFNRFLAKSILKIAEKFSPTYQWFIDTVMSLFQLDFNLKQNVNSQISIYSLFDFKMIEQVIVILEEGVGEKGENVKLRKYAAQTAIEFVLSLKSREMALLQTNVNRPFFIYLMWVIGEFSVHHFVESNLQNFQNLLDILIELFSQKLNQTIDSYAMNSALKTIWKLFLLSETIHVLEQDQIRQKLANLLSKLNPTQVNFCFIEKLVVEYSNLLNCDTKDRKSFYKVSVTKEKGIETKQNPKNLDYAAMEAFEKQQIIKGAKIYLEKSQRKNVDDESKKQFYLKVQPYSNPFQRHQITPENVIQPQTISIIQQQPQNQPQYQPQNQPQNQPQIILSTTTKKWGADEYQNKEEVIKMNNENANDNEEKEMMRKLLFQTRKE